jgi:hypothetical protein
MGGGVTNIIIIFTLSHPIYSYSYFLSLIMIFIHTGSIQTIYVSICIFKNKCECMNVNKCECMNVNKCECMNVNKCECMNVNKCY